VLDAAEVVLGGGGLEGGFELVFELGGQFEVGDHAASGAQEVVVVGGEVFGQLEAGELVGGDDAAHDTGLGEHGHGAVGGALGKSPGGLDDLGDGQRSTGGLEGVDQHPAPRGVALSDGGEAAGGNAVHVEAHDREL